MAKVGTGTAMWECLVLSNEEGHAFSTPIRLGDNPEGEGCVKRHVNGTCHMVREFDRFFGDDTPAAQIVIVGFASVRNDPQDICIIQVCRSSVILVPTAMHNGDIKDRVDAGPRITWIKGEDVRHGHVHMW